VRNKLDIYVFIAYCPEVVKLIIRKLWFNLD